jgi:hypothetical protein
MKPKDLVSGNMLLLLSGAVAYGFWHYYTAMLDGDPRPWRAHMDIHTLDRAARFYFEENKQWPPDLETLTKPMPDGKPPFIKDASQLIDSWGRPYQYDPRQLNPKTGRPLIWCVPDPSKPESKFTNWD